MDINVFSLFILLTGFVLGLGAVTVIDWHGFLARQSAYWTQATIRTHKVTKPLIWSGMILAIIGGAIYLSLNPSPFDTFFVIDAVILVLNGSFLSFYISPRLLKREKEKRDTELLPLSMQRAITLSFFVSIGGWWSGLFMFAWHLAA